MTTFININGNTFVSDKTMALPKSFEAAIVSSAKYFARGLVMADKLKGALVALAASRRATLARAGVKEEHMEFDAMMSFLIEAPTLADDLARAGLCMDGEGAQLRAIRNLTRRFTEEYPLGMGQSLEDAGQPGRQVVAKVDPPEEAIKARFMHEVSMKAFDNTAALIAALAKEVERQPAQMTFTRQAPALFPPLLASLFQMARVEPRKVHYDHALMMASIEAQGGSIDQPVRTLHRDSLLPMLSKILVPKNQDALLAKATEIRNIAILRRWVHATR